MYDDIRFVHGVHIAGTGLIKMRIHTGFHEAGYFHFIPADLPGEVGEHRRGGDDFHLPAESEAGADFPQPEKDRAAAPRMARGIQRPKTIFFNMRNSPLYLFNNDPQII